MKISSIFSSPLFYIFLVIVILRYIGTAHGFPYVYNVDEPTLVKITLGLRFNPLIERFDWPHFNYYFHFIFYWLFIKFRAVVQMVGFDGILKTAFPILWDDPFVFYFLSRIINTTLSILSVVPVFYITKEIFNKKTAVLTAISYLLFPYLVSHSRYAIQDSAMMSWLTFYFWFLYRYWNSKKLKDLLYAALFIGLATGVKYNAILFFIMVPILLMIQARPLDKVSILNYVKKNLVAGFVLVTTFLLVCISIIFHFDLFWSDKHGVGIFWQLQSNLVKYNSVEIPYRAFLDYVDILEGTGIVLSIGFILFPFLYRKLNVQTSHKIFLLVAWVVSVGYFLYATRIVLSGPRFYLPIYPLIAIIGSCVYFELSKLNRFLYISIFYLTVLFGVVVYRTIPFISQPTVNLAYYRYLELVENNEVYIRGEDIERLNSLNNLNLKKLDKSDELKTGTYIIGSRPLELENVELTETIDNMEGYNRLGPTIYIYRLN